MNYCTCGDNQKRKIYTNKCLECGKAIVAEKDLTDVYRFRAESISDVAGFLKNLWPGCQMRSLKIECDQQFPDCEVKMKIENTDLMEIRIALSGVEDGHVMIESLNFAKEYTGERWFDAT